MAENSFICLEVLQQFLKKRNVEDLINKANIDKYEALVAWNGAVSMIKLNEKDVWARECKLERIVDELTQKQSLSKVHGCASVDTSLKQTAEAFPDSRLLLRDLIALFIVHNSKNKVNEVYCRLFDNITSKDPRCCFRCLEVVNIRPVSFKMSKDCSYRSADEASYLGYLLSKAKNNGYTQDDMMHAWQDMISLRTDANKIDWSCDPIDLAEALTILFDNKNHAFVMNHYAAYLMTIVRLFK